VSGQLHGPAVLSKAKELPIAIEFEARFALEAVWTIRKSENSKTY
jgi:hypothetical protein